MVTKTFFAVKSPIIENMISGDGLGCHGQWILRVPDHGSRDRLHLAHSSCLAVILSAGRRIHCFFCYFVIAVVVVAIVVVVVVIVVF